MNALAVSTQVTEYSGGSPSQVIRWQLVGFNDQGSVSVISNFTTSLGQGRVCYIREGILAHLSSTHLTFLDIDVNNVISVKNSIAFAGTYGTLATLDEKNGLILLRNSSNFNLEIYEINKTLLTISLIYTEVLSSSSQSTTYGLVNGLRAFWHNDSLNDKLYIKALSSSGVKTVYTQELYISGYEDQVSWISSSLSGDFMLVKLKWVQGAFNFNAKLLSTSFGETL